MKAATSIVNITIPCSALHLRKLGSSRYAKLYRFPSRPYRIHEQAAFYTCTEHNTLRSEHSKENQPYHARDKYHFARHKR